MTSCPHTEWKAAPVGVECVSCGITWLPESAADRELRGVVALAPTLPPTGNGALTADECLTAPIEQVDAELRRMGADPVALAERGGAYVRELIAVPSNGKPAPQPFVAVGSVIPPPCPECHYQHGARGCPRAPAVEPPVAERPFRGCDGCDATTGDHHRCSPCPRLGEQGTARDVAHAAALARESELQKDFRALQEDYDTATDDLLARERAALARAEAAERKFAATLGEDPEGDARALIDCCTTDELVGRIAKLRDAEKRAEAAEKRADEHSAKLTAARQGERLLASRLGLDPDTVSSYVQLDLAISDLRKRAEAAERERDLARRYQNNAVNNGMRLQNEKRAAELKLAELTVAARDVTLSSGTHGAPEGQFLVGVVPTLRLEELMDRQQRERGQETQDVHRTPPLAGGDHVNATPCTPDKGARPGVAGEAVPEARQSGLSGQGPDSRERPALSTKPQPAGVAAAIDAVRPELEALAGRIDLLEDRAEIEHLNAIDFRRILAGFEQRAFKLESAAPEPPTAAEPGLTSAEVVERIRAIYPACRLDDAGAAELVEQYAREQIDAEIASWKRELEAANRSIAELSKERNAALNRATLPADESALRRVIQGRIAAAEPGLTAEQIAMHCIEDTNPGAHDRRIALVEQYALDALAGNESMAQQAAEALEAKLATRDAEIARLKREWQAQQERACANANEVERLRDELAVAKETAASLKHGYESQQRLIAARDAEVARLDAALRAALRDLELRATPASATGRGDERLRKAALAVVSDWSGGVIDLTGVRQGSALRRLCRLGERVEALRDALRDASTAPDPSEGEKP